MTLGWSERLLHDLDLSQALIQCDLHKKGIRSHVRWSVVDVKSAGMQHWEAYVHLNCVHSSCQYVNTSYLVFYHLFYCHCYMYREILSSIVTLSSSSLAAWITPGQEIQKNPWCSKKKPHSTDFFDFLFKLGSSCSDTHRKLEETLPHYVAFYFSSLVWKTLRAFEK